jgi:hypothetical protein
MHNEGRIASKVSLGCVSFNFKGVHTLFSRREGWEVEIVDILYFASCL